MKGIKPSDAVVLYIERGFATVIWILAILKAGGCYVVLDKTYPVNRKRTILKLAESMFFVTDEMEPEGNELEDCLEHVTILETSAATWESKDLPATSLGENNTSNDDLAYGKASFRLRNHKRPLIAITSGLYFRIHRPTKRCNGRT